MTQATSRAKSASSPTDLSELTGPTVPKPSATYPRLSSTLGQVLDLVSEGTPGWCGDATALSALAFWTNGGLEVAQDPFARVATLAAFCANKQLTSQAG